jgi:hypothetical protein
MDRRFHFKSNKISNQTIGKEEKVPHDGAQALPSDRVPASRVSNRVPLVSRAAVTSASHFSLSQFLVLSVESGDRSDELLSSAVSNEYPSLDSRIKWPKSVSDQSNI